MVALRTSRTGAPTPDPADPFEGLFMAWRRLLTSVFTAVGRGVSSVGGSRPLRAAMLAVRYLRDPAGVLAAADAGQRSLLKEAGAVALAVGVALSFAVPATVGPPLVRRFLAAGWVAAWALARLFIMRSIAHGRADGTRSAVDDAWGPALLPFAFAVVDPLPLVALGVSALLTLRGLTGLGIERRASRRLVAVAFGGQLAAELLAWVSRGGLLYLVLTLRG